MLEQFDAEEIENIILQAMVDAGRPPLSEAQVMVLAKVKQTTPDNIKKIEADKVNRYRQILIKGPAILKRKNPEVNARLNKTMLTWGR